MANTCDFYLEVIGKSENIKRFEKIITNDASIHLYDDEYYIKGVEACKKESVGLFEDEFEVVMFSGVCRNSIESSHMLDSGKSPFRDRSYISLCDVSKLLGLSIEGFSEDTGNGFQEYYLAVNGKYNRLISANIEEINIKEGIDALQSFFNKHIDYGYTYDDIDKLVDNSGNIVIGGLDNFGVFDTVNHFEDLKNSLMKVHIFDSNTQKQKSFHNAIKYWSNSLGELHYHGKFDITEDMLPAPLKKIYQEYSIFDHYGSRAYLAETEKGYGIALINEYDETFAEDCSLSMDELFETALKDVEDIKNHPLFKDADIYLGGYTGFDECHELAVVFPADISYEAFDKAAKMLDTLSYKHAHEIRDFNNSIDSRGRKPSLDEKLSFIKNTQKSVSNDKENDRKQEIEL